METTFLRHILDDPADLASRRAYADWLMEQASTAQQEKGEFIALQIELAGKVRPRERRRLLEARQTELLARYGTAWAPPFRSLVSGYAFRNGLIESVVIGCAEFVLAGEGVFEHSPVHDVALRDQARHHVADLAGCPHLARITRLDLRRQNLGPTELGRLLGSPYLTRLRRLELDDNTLGDEGVRVLTLSPWFAQLTHLSLQGVGLTSTGARQLLAGLGATHGLTWLALHGNVNFNCVDAVNLLDRMASTLSPHGLQRARQFLEHLAGKTGWERYAALVRGRGTESVELLSRGLDHSRRQVRSECALRLAGQGKAALPALPGLVRRALEKDLPQRDAVHGKLPALEKHLSPGLRAWVKLLTIGEGEHALTAALSSGAPPLPPTVQSEFSALCERRLRWRHAHHPEEGLPALPAEAATDRSALRVLAFQVAERAEQDALRHSAPEQKVRAEAVSQRARDRECAWLCAWLIDLLRRHEAGGPP